MEKGKQASVKENVRKKKAASPKRRTKMGDYSNAKMVIEPDSKEQL